MLGKNITNAEEIKRIIRMYDEGDNVENIIDKTKLVSWDVFKAVFNFRFSFKKPDEFANDELWKLVTTEVKTFKGGA